MVEKEEGGDGGGRECVCKAAREGQGERKTIGQEDEEERIEVSRVKDDRTGAGAWECRRSKEGHRTQEVGLGVALFFRCLHCRCASPAAARGLFVRDTLAYVERRLWNGCEGE